MTWGEAAQVLAGIVGMLLAVKVFTAAVRDRDEEPRQSWDRWGDKQELAR